MRARLAPLLVLGLVTFGCSSSRHFPDESKDAERAIDRAEDAGAQDHSRIMLLSARDTLEEAKRAEDDAIRDRHAAREQFKAAQRRLERAKSRSEVKSRQRQEEEDLRSAQLASLDRIKAREDDLRRKDLPESDVKHLTETDTALANIRLRSSEATIATLDKELELLELERKDAQLDLDAAQARLDTAERRLDLSRALFQRAQVQAKVAEAESLDAKRYGIRAKLTEM